MDNIANAARAQMEIHHGPELESNPAAYDADHMRVIDWYTYHMAHKNLLPWWCAEDWWNLSKVMSGEATEAWEIEAVFGISQLWGCRSAYNVPWYEARASIQRECPYSALECRAIARGIDRRSTQLAFILKSDHVSWSTLG